MYAERYKCVTTDVGTIMAGHDTAGGWERRQRHVSVAYVPFPPSYLHRLNSPSTERPCSPIPGSSLASRTQTTLVTPRWLRRHPSRTAWKMMRSWCAAPSASTCASQSLRWTAGTPCFEPGSCHVFEPLSTCYIIPPSVRHPSLVLDTYTVLMRGCEDVVEYRRRRARNTDATRSEGGGEEAAIGATRIGASYQL